MQATIEPSEKQGTVANEIRSALGHTMVWGVGAILAKALSFLLLPLYTSYLTPSHMGILELSELSMSLLGMFLHMGIGAGILRQYQALATREARQALLSSALWFTSFTAVLLALSGLLLAKPVSAALLGPDVPWIYLYLSLVQLILGYIGTIPHSYIRAQQGTRRIVALDIAGSIFLAALAVFAIVVLDLSLLGVMLAASICSVAKLTVLCFWVRQDIKLSFNSDRLRELLAFGSPLIIANVTFFVLNFSDRFFLQRFQSLDAVGIYSVAYKFGFISNLILIQPFDMMWQARMYLINNRSDREQVFAHVLALYGSVLTLAGLGLALFSPEIIALMVHESYAASVGIIPVIALAYVFLGLGQFLQTGMYLSGRTGSIAKVSGLVAVVAVVLNYTLIPRYGAMGAAWATVVGFFVLAVGSYICSQRALPLRYGIRRVVLELGLAFGVYLAAMALPPASLLITVVIKIGLLCAFVGLIWATGVLSRDDLVVLSAIKDGLGEATKKWPAWTRFLTASGQARS